MIDFFEDSRLIENRTSNEELNNLISDFANSLEEFSNYSSMRLYGKNDRYYKPNKDSEELKDKAEIETAEMNRLSNISFQKLQVLMKFLRERGYLD